MVVELGLIMQNSSMDMDQPSLGTTKPTVMEVVFLTVMDIGVQMKTSTSKASPLKTIQRIMKVADCT